MTDPTLGSASPTPTRTQGPTERADVVIVGAGMAGLAAAVTLGRGGLDVVVLEREGDAGGRLRTADVGGTLADVGAGFVTRVHPRTLDTLGAAGSAPDLVPCRWRGCVVMPGEAVALTPRGLPHLARRLGLRGHADGLRHLVRVGTAWRSLDPTDPTGWESVAEGSIADYGLRSLDARLMALLVEPAVRGFLYWDPDRAAAAMLHVLTRTALTMRRPLVAQRGLGSLAAALGRRLGVRGGTSVTDLERSHDGGWLVHHTGPGNVRPILARRVILAVTADGAARLVPERFGSARTWLGSVTYSSATTMVLRTARPILTHDAAVFVSRAVHPRLVLASAASGRSAKLRPSVGDVLTLYGTPRLDVGEVEPALSLLPREYRVPWTADPVVTNWSRAVPEFTTEHLARLAELDVTDLAAQGLFLAGDYLRSPFIEGAVVSGQLAAEAILREH
jgi:protoporphyrinogen oxidase